MTEKPLEIRVPRQLKGRRARVLWRRLAPQLTQAGAISPISEPLLMHLCRRLGRMTQFPESVTPAQVAEITKLAKQLGLKL